MRSKQGNANKRAAYPALKMLTNIMDPTTLHVCLLDIDCGSKPVCILCCLIDYAGTYSRIAVMIQLHIVIVRV